MQHSILETLSTSVALQLPYQVHCNPAQPGSWTLTVMSCQGILAVRPVVALHDECKSGQHLWQPTANQRITTNHAPLVGVLTQPCCADPGQSSSHSVLLNPYWLEELLWGLHLSSMANTAFCSYTIPTRRPSSVAVTDKTKNHELQSALSHAISL